MLPVVVLLDCVRHVAGQPSPLEPVFRSLPEVRESRRVLLAICDATKYAYSSV